MTSIIYPLLHTALLLLSSLHNLSEPVFELVLSAVNFFSTTLFVVRFFHIFSIYIFRPRYLSISLIKMRWSFSIKICWSLFINISRPSAHIVIFCFLSKNNIHRFLSSSHRIRSLLSAIGLSVPVPCSILRRSIRTRCAHRLMCNMTYQKIHNLSNRGYSMATNSDYLGCGSWQKWNVSPMVIKSKDHLPLPKIPKALTRLDPPWSLQIRLGPPWSACIRSDPPRPA